VLCGILVVVAMLSRSVDRLACVRPSHADFFCLGLRIGVGQEYRSPQDEARTGIWLRAWDPDVMPIAGGRRDGLALAVVCVRRLLSCCPLSLSYRIGKGTDFLFGGAKSGMSNALLIDKAQLSIGYRLR
jgi:hypothetical protein